MLRMKAAGVRQILFGDRFRYVVAGSRGMLRTFVWDGVPTELSVKAIGEKQQFYITDERKALRGDAAVVLRDHTAPETGTLVSVRVRAAHHVFEENGQHIRSLQGTPLSGRATLLHPWLYVDRELFDPSIAVVNPRQILPEILLPLTAWVGPTVSLIYGNNLQGYAVTAFDQVASVCQRVDREIYKSTLYAPIHVSDGLMFYSIGGEYTVLRFDGTVFTSRRQHFVRHLDFRGSIFLSAYGKEVVQVGAHESVRRYNFGTGNIQGGVIAPDGLSAYVWSSRELIQFDIDL